MPIPWSRTGTSWADDGAGGDRYRRRRRLGRGRSLFGPRPSRQITTAATSASDHDCADRAPHHRERLPSLHLIEAGIIIDILYESSGEIIPACCLRLSVRQCAALTREDGQRRDGTSIGAQLVRPDIRQSSIRDRSLSSRTSTTPAIASAKMMINPISAADLRWSVSSSRSDRLSICPPMALLPVKNSPGRKREQRLRA